MSRRFFLCALLTVSLYCILAQAYALECEKESISVRADSGNYAYGEFTCTSYSDLFADYEGNMSGDISIFVEGYGNKYTISLLADASKRISGVYKGKIILTNDDSEELEISTRVRIGEGSDEEITLGKYGLSFEMDKPGLEACYNVSIKNTGNAELWDLHAEYGNPELANMAYNNKSWIYISDLGGGEFPVGEERGLEICVNTNRTKGTELPNQETTVSVVAEAPNAGTVREEITVSLRTDLDTAWQKNYEELRDQHKALEQNYSVLRVYKDMWEDRYVNGSGALYTYSALSKAYRDLKTEYAALEKKVNASNYSQYESLDGRLSDLGSRYKALEGNYSFLRAKAANMSDKTEASALENESIRLKAELDGLRPLIEELRAQLEEKDALLAALQAKQKKNDSAPAKAKAIAGKGFAEEYFPFLPYLAATFMLIAVGVIIMSRRNKHSTRKEIVLKIPVIKKDRDEDSEEDNKREEERRLKEQQKDALRQLLMQKLAEKSAEKKNG